MPERFVIAGSSGLVGTAVADALRERGGAVTRLVRRPPTAPDEVQWMHRDTLDPAVVEGAAAVLNFSGASIGRVPWTPGYRDVLVESRLKPTRMLARAIRSSDAPAPFVSASAAGIYGSAPGAELTEDAPRGHDFLADLCAEWEDAARDAGGEVAHLRTAPIVHRSALLKPLVPLTKLGVAGRIGPGTQQWSWISLPDAVNAIVQIIDRRLSGPVNLAAPTSTSAWTFIRILASILHRPAIVPAPSFALRAALGRDFADAMLLADQQVRPAVLEASGFEFVAPGLRGALEQALRE